jgi:hypothetical protein
MYTNYTDRNSGKGGDAALSSASSATSCPPSLSRPVPSSPAIQSPFCDSPSKQARLSDVSTLFSLTLLTALVSNHSHSESLPAQGRTSRHLLRRKTLRPSTLEPSNPKSRHKSLISLFFTLFTLFTPELQRNTRRYSSASPCLCDARVPLKHRASHLEIHLQVPDLAFLTFHFFHQTPEPNTSSVE